jgi:hypothetical protein
MQGKAPHGRRQTVRPGLAAVLAARVLIVLAAVLGVLAMHSTPALGTAAGVLGHPAAVSAAEPAAEPAAAVIVLSADQDPDGCCCVTCADEAAVCLGTPGVTKFTAPEVADVVLPGSVAEAGLRPWYVRTQLAPSRSMGLHHAALAVVRI